MIELTDGQLEVLSAESMVRHLDAARAERPDSVSVGEHTQAHMELRSARGLCSLCWRPATTVHGLCAGCEEDFTR